MVSHSLRVFAQEQEIDRFVESIMGSQAQAGEGSIAFAKKEQGKVYFSFSFPLGEEEWVQMMTDAAEVIAAGTLGKQKKDHMAWKFLVAVFVGFLCWVAWKVPDGEGIAFVALFIGIIFLLLLRKQIEPPEKEIRRQVSRGTAQDSYGDWEVVITETGLWRSLQNISGKNIVMVPWESLLCMVETDRELFFFKKDKRGFFGLLKGDMEGKEQIESLKELCREKQLPILLGKQKKDTSRRILSLLTGIMIVGLIAGIFYVVYKSPQRNISPDYVSFEEQMFVLRSFGFTIPDELEETLWDYMEDDETKTYVEEYPYTWLLLNLAWGDVDQGTEVFWFDFESFDISTNYIWVLEGMKELSAGSILDSVENIQEDIEDMDWEKGTGTITVSLEWEGQEHSWEMNVENDWIDPKVLGIYNGMLEKEDVSERFYATFDDGQGALVFYCSKDWARAFENATGLNLEAYVEEFK